MSYCLWSLIPWHILHALSSIPSLFLTTCRYQSQTQTSSHIPTHSQTHSQTQIQTQTHKQHTHKHTSNTSAATVTTTCRTVRMLYTLDDQRPCGLLSGHSGQPVSSSANKNKSAWNTESIDRLHFLYHHLQKDKREMPKTVIILLFQSKITNIPQKILHHLQARAALYTPTYNCWYILWYVFSTFETFLRRRKLFFPTNACLNGKKLLKSLWTKFFHPPTLPFGQKLCKEQDWVVKTDMACVTG